MKNKDKKNLAVIFLSILFFASAMSTQNVKGLGVSHRDSSWASLVLTGPDLTAPGSAEIYTLSGTFSTNVSGSVHLKLWINTASQQQEVIFDNFVLNSRNYLAGSSFVKSYQVMIPTDAESNNFVYATIDAVSSYIVNVAVTLIQNPTYSELQNQVFQLQTDLTNLEIKLSNLNSTYTNLLANYNGLLNNSASDRSSLLAQIGNLQTQLNDLNSTNSDLQFQITNLQTEKTNLLTQASTLQQNNSNLQAQVNTLQTENNELISQNTVLQDQVSQLQYNSTNLQIIINTLTNQSSSIQSQLNNFQAENNDLKATNNTISTLMYLATFVAIVFIAATAYIIFIVVRGKDSKNTSENETPVS